jgi:hypothetical protein
MIYMITNTNREAVGDMVVEYPNLKGHSGWRSQVKMNLK